MAIKTDLEIFEGIYKNKVWVDTKDGKAKSRSGHGSELESTPAFRQALTEIVDMYGIKTIADIPCGDFHFMGHWIEKEGNGRHIQYFGGDVIQKIVQENQRRHSSPNIAFKHFNILTDEIPKVDLLIVKDLSIHLPLEAIAKMHDRIRASGAKYVILTTQDTREMTLSPQRLRHVNCDIDIGDYRIIDMSQPPFLGVAPPIIMIQEKSWKTDFRKSANALWRCEDIPMVNRALIGGPVTDCRSDAEYDRFYLS